MGSVLVVTTVRLISLLYLSLVPWLCAWEVRAIDVWFQSIEGNRRKARFYLFIRKKTLED